MRRFQRPTAEPAGFAVVDLETTGVYPSKDRIIEVAVVHLDVSGQLIGEFSTLIDPHRDVGPTHIHGITAADVMGAPGFPPRSGCVGTPQRAGPRGTQRRLRPAIPRRRVQPLWGAAATAAGHVHDAAL